MAANPENSGCGIAPFEIRTVEGWDERLTSGDLRRSTLRIPGEPAVVLIVAQADEQRQTIASLMQRGDYRIIEASSGTNALASMANIRPDLIVLDRRLGENDVFECCRKLKSIRKTESIPILVVTPGASVADEIAGIHAGVDEFLRFPVQPELFLARVRALIRHKTAVDRLEESESILFALAQAVEKRDHCTGGHCHRLAMLSVAFGMRLSLPQEQLLALHRGGYLHDIGKIALPDSILFKPGKLSAEEWSLMETHSVRGEEICRPLRSLRTVLPIIRHHHERWDGSGYPDGLRNRTIPLLARVLQLADVYDALTSERPYKPAYSSEVAAGILVEELRSGWRDPELTRAFLDLPFGALQAAARASSPLEEFGGFEASLRNLRSHLSASAN